MTAKALSKPFPPGYQTHAQISELMSSASRAQALSTGLKKANTLPKQEQPNSKQIPRTAFLSAPEMSSPRVVKLENILNKSAEEMTGSFPILKLANSNLI